MDQSVRIWDESGVLIRSIEMPFRNVEGVEFSPDGELLAATGNDEAARLFNVATGKVVKEFRPQPRHNVSVAAFAADGLSLFAKGQDKSVDVRDVATGASLRSFDSDHFVTTLSLSPDGKNLAGGSYGGIVQIVDAACGKVKRLIRTTGKPTFSPNGKYIAATAPDASCRIWDTESGKLAVVCRMLKFSQDSDESPLWIIHSAEGEYAASPAAEPLVRLARWSGIAA